MRSTCPGVMIDRAMRGFHDRDSGSHAATSVAARRRGRAPVDRGARAARHDVDVDVVSDLLRRVRLSASMLFLVEASRPWSTSAPRASQFASAVLPGARHVVSYHVVVRGSCWAGLEGGEPVRLGAGDVFVVPHGHAYFLADPRHSFARCGDAGSSEFFRRMAAGELPPVLAAAGGAGETTEFLCGFLGCDARPFNPLLASLPPMVRIADAVGASPRMRLLVDLALFELRDRRPGARDALLRVAEQMFAELLRTRIDPVGDVAQGWFAALADPLVSRALARLHAAPQRPWTLALLADETDASRSVLVERFSRRLGRPPMRYLAAWRMQLGAGMLCEPGALVKQVAAAVGYESEAAFSRAFKRATGVAPADWRERGA
ncbi:MAG TPA: AraC family transcriptional regulator [Zeimonas sp.]